MKARVKYLVFLAMFASPFAYAGEKAGDLYEEARKQYHELRLQSLDKQTREKWITVAGMFEPVLQAKPEIPHHPKALFTVGKIYQHLFERFAKREDAEKALESFNALAERFPKDHLTDDALLGYIQVAQAVSEDGKARWALEQMARNFPHSNLVATAKKSFTVFEPILIEKPEEPSLFTLQEKPRTLAWLNLILPAAVKKISHTSDDSATEITVTFSSPVNVRHFFVPDDGKNGDRLVFDLSPTTIGRTLSGAHTIKDSRLNRVRAALFQKDETRIVLDLKAKVKYTLSRGKNPHRLVVKVFNEKEGKESDTQVAQLNGVEAAKREEREILHNGHREFSPQAEGKAEPATSRVLSDGIGEIIKASANGDSAPTTATDGRVEGGTVKVALALPDKKPSLLPAMRIRTIAIDPGHGGYDTGAIGGGKTKEKDITLQISKRVAEKVKKELKLDVVLTRDKDKYLELSERMTIATANNADLFISVHCNANKSKKASGISTYFLNDTSDVAAKRIAARENNMSFEDMSNLKRILLDLSIKSNTDDSQKLASLIQSGMVNSVREKYPDARDLGVRNAIFMVLLETQIPAILIETSFLSNPVEEKRLKSAEYQELIADGIVKGIKSYIEARNLSSSL
ncbi:MAG: hypothetical protein Kow0090_07380 [Myxococcota bacterium]